MSRNRTDIQEKLERLNQGLTGIATPAADRVRGDLAAAIYHCGRHANQSPIIAIIGGTGTGKSTIVNRLLGSEVSATSFRRTFTAGPVLITRHPLLGGFAALIHMNAGTLPARGQSDRVTIIRSDEPILNELSLVDTPDIDGELVEHHIVADRIFRWCDAVLFLVSPEKYQMPELQPYYRLAQRYGLPALYVLNKADGAAVVDDYEQLLIRSGIASPTVLGIARDDATWQPDPNRQLDPARLQALRVNAGDAGLQARVDDVIARVNDQLLQPLLDQRSRIDRTIANLGALNGDAIEMDVHPVTQQLQRRMREKSVLYLIGPTRILDRIRSVPSMIVRLPRGIWDWTRSGEFKMPGTNDLPTAEAPDFRSIVVEQFQALQTRIEDLINTSLPGEKPPESWKMPTTDAGTIVDTELGQLRTWLETRWNATPRDTAMLNRLLKVIPGTDKLGKYSEAAPYLLALACVTHSAMLGHLDILVLGGYSAFTWLTERLSNEVASKTRETNTAISNGYDQLATRQVEKAITWLDHLAPSRSTLEDISRRIEEVRKQK